MSQKLETMRLSLNFQMRRDTMPAHIIGQAAKSTGFYCGAEVYLL